MSFESSEAILMCKESVVLSTQDILDLTTVPIELEEFHADKIVVAHGVFIYFAPGTVPFSVEAETLYLNIGYPDFIDDDPVFQKDLKSLLTGTNAGMIRDSVVSRIAAFGEVPDLVFQKPLVAKFAAGNEAIAGNGKMSITLTYTLEDPVVP